MAFSDIFKVSRKTFFNPTRWFGYETFKYQNQFIGDILKNTFAVPTPMREETFEQAVKRMHVSEHTLKTRTKLYRTYALIFLLLAVFIFLYGFYLLMYHLTFPGWLLSMAVSGLCLSQAFRFDFWALQIKKRKLGLTFSEWRSSFLESKEPSK